MTLSEGLRLAAFLPGLYAAFLFSVLIHEAGHAIAGVTLGFRLLAFEVGPFRFIRTQQITASRWRFRWGKSNLVGGSTSMRAPSVNLSIPAARYAGVVFAGPCANVIFALFLSGLAIETGDSHSMILGVPVFMCLALAFLTLIPVRGKRADSDGRVLFRLTFNRPYREAIVALLMFIERLTEFRSQFAAGDISQATTTLEHMRLACYTPRQATLKSIVDHLQEHIVSGESLETCQWSPQKVSTEQIA